MESIRIINKQKDLEFKFEVNGKDLTKDLGITNLSIDIRGNNIPEIKLDLDAFDIDITIDGDIVIDKITVPDWLKARVYDKLILQLKQYKDMEV